MMTSRQNQNQSEIAKAKAMLQSLQAKLQQTRAAKDEKKAEMQEIDRRHHTLEQTGDINKMMRMKQKSMTLGKELTTLAAAENECLQRIDSVKRYLETLTRKLDGLRKERDALAEKLAADDLPVDTRATLLTLSSRLKMQIEALEEKG